MSHGHLKNGPHGEYAGADESWHDATEQLTLTARQSYPRPLAGPAMTRQKALIAAW